MLHFFLAITILGLPFLNFPKLSLLTGAFIILGYKMSWINMHWLYTLLQEPLHLPIAYTQDLVSLVPWFGVYLLGLAAGYYKLQEIFLNLEILNRKNLINSSLALLRATLFYYIFVTPNHFICIFLSNITVFKIYVIK
ncbi:MAG: heparan-alpha-glucosaminide N-acetyltransferase domain-containing protein [Sulfurimonas sp.]|nr:heparan-alpha-glucosaminide N-acetyltransferase domain-containing protein [Sulfurimonas sp.]